MLRLLFLSIALIWAICPPSTGAQSPVYDPLAVPVDFEAAYHDLGVVDVARKRTIPVRLYLPAAPGPRPVVLFSHGLGGSRENGVYLAHHLAARGYVAVFLQHPGSDESVWKDKRPRIAVRDAKKAANAENLRLRIGDVHAVLDRLAEWVEETGHPAAGRLDLSHIGMSGHSFGAITTQAVSGQRAPGDAARYTDERIDAAVIYSPSAPRAGDVIRAFGDVDIPWMLMTGTEDTAPIDDIELADRLAVYPALPAGGTYEVVLDGAAHSAFSDAARRRDRDDRNPNHHRVILALTTAFLDTYLKGSSEAKTWLEGQGPAGVLETGDRWQWK